MIVVTCKKTIFSIIGQVYFCYVSFIDGDSLRMIDKKFEIRL